MDFHWGLNACSQVHTGGKPGKIHTAILRAMKPPTTTPISLHHPLLLLLSVSGEPAGATATNQPPNRRGLLQLLKPKTKYYTTTLECGLSGFPGAWRILKRASSFARLQKQPRHSCRQAVLVVRVENPIKNSLKTGG